MYSYHAESDVELNLSVGEYVVVRKVFCQPLSFLICLGFYFQLGYALLVNFFSLAHPQNDSFSPNISTGFK